MWTVIAGAEWFYEPGWEGSCKAFKSNVHVLIKCAAKQLKYFLYPTTEKVTFKSFKISFFSQRSLGSVFPAFLIVLAWVSFSFPHCAPLLELWGQQTQLLWQMALGDDLLAGQMPGQLQGQDSAERGPRLWNGSSRVSFQLRGWMLLALGGSFGLPSETSPGA